MHFAARPATDAGLSRVSIFRIDGLSGAFILLRSFAPFRLAHAGVKLHLWLRAASHSCRLLASIWDRLIDPQAKANEAARTATRKATADPMAGMQSAHASVTDSAGRYEHARSGARPRPARREAAALADFNKALALDPYNAQAFTAAACSIRARSSTNMRSTISPRRTAWCRNRPSRCWRARSAISPPTRPKEAAADLDEAVQADPQQRAGLVDAGPCL